MTRDLPPRGLADALFTTTQQRVLGLLFGQPERSYYATELIGLAGAGRGAVQRELARLERSRLVTVRQVGNQRHYQANPQSPLFEELTGIARKTFGIAEPLRRALAPLASKIHGAFVYGSVAKRQDTSQSDVDLMIVSDKLSYADVYPLLEPLQAELGRTVNPTVMTRAAVRKGIKDGKSFMKRVWAQPKIFVVGTEDDLAA